MATTKKETEVKEVKETKATEDNRAYWEEKIPYKIPFDRNDNSDVFVAVNGKSFQIQRGVDVMIPRNVVAVLEQSAEQDLATWRATQAAEKEFEDEIKAKGL